MGPCVGRYLPYTSKGVFRDCIRTRDAATLLPIINQHVAPGILLLLLYSLVTHAGTIIHTDKWSGHRGVCTLPSVGSHSTVNHSQNFVAPSGVHTQNIESYWNRTKIKLKHMRGCYTHQTSSYPDDGDEFM